jgi:hypothetical protein
VIGRVVGLPTALSTSTGTRSLSVEVSEQSAATVAASDDVRVVLIQPGTDIAYADDTNTLDTTTPDTGTGAEGP